MTVGMERGMLALEDESVIFFIPSKSKQSIWLNLARLFQVTVICLTIGPFITSDGQDYTTAPIQSSVPIGQFIAVGVTIVPSGGSEQPIGLRVLGVNL